MSELAWLSRFPWSRQSLADDDVQLWQLNPAQLGAKLGTLRQHLDPAEQERAGRFHHAADRHQYIVTRGLLRMLIEAYGVAPAAEVNFTRARQGKPRLSERHAASPLEFSVSHTRDRSVFAFARTLPVGVDVEQIGELSELNELAAASFSRREWDEYQSLSPSERLRAFYNAWTRKEAFIKATGEGLERRLDTVTVTFIPGHEPRVLEVDGSRSEAAAWTLHDPTNGQSDEAYALALAVRSRSLRITPRLWESLM